MLASQSILFLIKCFTRVIFYEQVEVRHQKRAVCRKNKNKGVRNGHTQSMYVAAPIDLFHCREREREIKTYMQWRPHGYFSRFLLSFSINMATKNTSTRNTIDTYWKVSRFIHANAVKFKSRASADPLSISPSFYPSSPLFHTLLASLQPTPWVFILLVRKHIIGFRKMSPLSILLGKYISFSCFSVFAFLCLFVCLFLCCCVREKDVAPWLSLSLCVKSQKSNNNSTVPRLLRISTKPVDECTLFYARVRSQNKNMDKQQKAQGKRNYTEKSWEEEEEKEEKEGGRDKKWQKKASNGVWYESKFPNESRD